MNTRNSSFQQYYENLLNTSPSKKPLDWRNVKGLSREKIDCLNDMVPVDVAEEKSLLDSLLVCKLNGGLGTSMGCAGPKAAIEVKNNKTFLDLIIEQIICAKDKTGADVQLILMNSFYTEKDTDDILANYASSLSIKTFSQSKRRRTRSDTHIPLSEEAFGNEAYYPPGHGDFYNCFFNQGLLSSYLEQGKKFVFISNADNLGATIDTRIIKYMEQHEIPFLCEVAERTRADSKGGTFIYNEHGSPKLLEIAQVPNGHKKDFESIKDFGIFNTNNVWINLKALKKAIDENSLNLDLIFNAKEVGGIPVVQTETAMASAITSFSEARCLLVDRKRFLPVKKTDDLFMIRSDLFIEKDGQLYRNPKRDSESLPLVRLGEFCKTVAGMEKRIPSLPSIIDLELLTIVGDVHFGQNITLRNQVILTCTEGSLFLPDSSVINNQALAGRIQIAEL